MKDKKSIIINNGVIITQNSNDDVIKRGSVLIEDGVITRVDDTVNMGLLDVDKEIDARGKIVIPGFVNAHTHTGYYMMRGLGMDRDLMDWLNDGIWPWLMDMDEDDAYLASLLGYIECLRGGTTSVFDNQSYPSYNSHLYDIVAQAACHSKLRVSIAPGFFDLQVFSSHPDMVRSLENIEKECRGLIKRWHDKRRIKILISPINFLFCSEKAIKMALNISEDSGVKMHTHVAECEKQYESFKERFGMGYIEASKELGVLNSNFMSVHTVWVLDNEIDLLGDSGASVVTNPTSNMLLGIGVAPLIKMLNAGVNIAIGTDSPNNSNDMFEAMKYTNLLQKISHRDPCVIDAKTVLKMATINGAKAIGMEDSLGSIEKGKQADLALVDYRQINNIPMHDPVSTLVYSANAGNVTDVLVNGDLLLENGKITFLNEERLIDEVQSRAELIRQRIGR